MSSTSTSSPSMPAASDRQTERIMLKCLLRAGLLAAAFAAAGTMLIRTLAIAVGAVPENYQPLQPGPVIAAPVIAALVATGVLATIARRVRRPIRAFRIVAGVGLLLSFSGPLQAGAGTMQGGTASGATVTTMLLMHIVAAVIIVGLLTTIGREPQARI
ncbi:MAG TPA: DUF6069 family protein [Chloroflexota bacterium]|nr:DUF6069 family protein [Chloroflexota bacterium]